ncbi:MAG: hypothetical protein Greene07142_972 [Parcubacteria group bacterium Greene0714_2]|nr:MAG: hypothetical protein Greene07142_972 [Parcubacteria group bacterium Greene0714_2]
MNARYYDPAIGRFVSPDPLLSGALGKWAYETDQINLYSYAKNNSKRFIDPTGYAAGPGYYQASPGLKEFGFAVRHPGIASNIGFYRQGSTNISTQSVNFAVNMRFPNVHPEEERGSLLNAFRHVFWQSLITAKYGLKIAKEVGNAHEDNPFVDLANQNFSGDNAWEQADQTVDLLNNQIGRSIGSAYSESTSNDLAAISLMYFHTAGFYTAEKAGDGVKIIQTRLDDKQYLDSRSVVDKVGQDGLIKKK